MLSDYKEKHEAYKARIATLEAVEVEREIKEIDLKNNGGKPTSFFKVPVFRTSKRKD